MYCCVFCKNFPKFSRGASMSFIDVLWNWYPKGAL